MVLFSSFYGNLFQMEVTINGADGFLGISNMVPAIYACSDTIKTCVKFRKDYDCEMSDESVCFRLPIVKGKRHLNLQCLLVQLHL